MFSVDDSHCINGGGLGVFGICATVLQAFEFLVSSLFLAGFEAHEP